MMADRRVVIIREVEAWNKRARGKAALLHYLEKPAPETVVVLVQGAAPRDDERPHHPRDRALPGVPAGGGGTVRAEARGEMAPPVRRRTRGQLRARRARAFRQRHRRQSGPGAGRARQARGPGRRRAGDAGAGHRPPRRAPRRDPGRLVRRGPPRRDRAGGRSASPYPRPGRRVGSRPGDHARRPAPRARPRPGPVRPRRTGRSAPARGIRRDPAGPAPASRLQGGGGAVEPARRALAGRAGRRRARRRAPGRPAAQGDVARRRPRRAARPRDAAGSSCRGCDMRKTERRNDGTTEGRSPALLSVFPSFRLSVLLLLSVFPSLRLCAQSDPRLVTAVRLAQDGRSDSARAVEGRILAALEPTDSLYPEALYTLGLLAASEQDRRLCLRRVVVDCAVSAGADDALLQLVQLDSAVGDAAGAVREVDQLLRDYPGSPLTAVAALWGSRAAGDRKDSATACRMADAGLAAVGDDIDLRNQLEFQKQRCQGLEALAAESTRAAVADSTARAKADSVARGARP